MITINNSVFNAQGASVKDKVYGITLNGAEDVLLENCSFANKGYSAVLNHCTGNVVINGCVFNCDDVYNPIEGSQTVDNGNVVVKNCEFVGKPGNNFINFYQVADGSQHLVEGCTFNPSVDNNIIRISNRKSAAMEVTVKDCAYTYLPGEATEYTGFVLCQDYTKKSGVPQDFSKTVVNIDNVTCEGEKITEAGAAKGCVYYVYQDGVGIITGENDPVVNIK